MMNAMKVLADAKAVGQLIDELAQGIMRLPRSNAPWAIVGIRRRGDVLARRLAEKLAPDHLGSVDITLYRDDLSEVGPQAVVRTTEIDFDLDGCELVLVDDVLMSGRSVRAAMQSILDFGRPRRIHLAVLVDRGGRELPIAADVAAMTVDPGPAAHVHVHLTPTDPADQVVLLNHDPAQSAR